MRLLVLVCLCAWGVMSGPSPKHERDVVATRHVHDRNDGTAALVGVDCDVDANAPKCKPRTGAAKIPGASQFGSIAQELLNELLGEGASGSRDMQANEFQAYLFDAYKHLAFVKDTMQENQGEIDEVVQHLLPNAQRSSLALSASLSSLREKLAVVNVQLRQHAQSLPREDFVTEQRRNTNIIATLHRMKNDITRQEVQNTLQANMLLQVETQQQVASGSAVDKAALAIDSLVESFKQIRILERAQLQKERENWGSDLEELQSRMESIMTSSTDRQTQVYGSMVFSRKLREYLKAVTSTQYRSLDMYSLLQRHIGTFGMHLDRSLRMRAQSVPLFKDLIALLLKGDLPLAPNTINGCDGFGGAPDACGVCRGDNITCADCTGEVLGGRQWDVCAVCGDGKATECRYFCDGIANSGRMEDVCGVCGGNDLTCAGCDAIPHSPRQFDMCGVCGGDGASCADTKGCAGTVCASANTISCPLNSTVNPNGFHGCCFDPALDCVPR